MAQADGGIYWHMHDGWTHMIGLGWGMFGGFGMLFFWVLLIVVIVLLVRGRPAQERQSPLDILKERFARGEISKEEYEERRKVLSG